MVDIRTISSPRRPIFFLPLVLTGATMLAISGCNFVDLRKLVSGRSSTQSPATYAEIDQFVELSGDMKSAEQALLGLREQAKKAGLEEPLKDWISETQLQKIRDAQRNWLRSFYASHFSSAEMRRLIEIHQSDEWKKLATVYRNSATTVRPASAYIQEFMTELRKARAKKQH